MTIVTNETELQNAISSSETEIQIANDIEITTEKFIARSISIQSTPNNNFTLLKSADSNDSIFNIDNSALLTLTNITIDGNKENRNPSATNRTLIFVNFGSLTLGENAILQNNICYSQGGAVYIASLIYNALGFKMTDNAIIRGCKAGQGGAIYASVNYNYEFDISDNAVIENNEATSDGGGIWITSDKAIPINITSGNVTISRNKANRGGGIYIDDRTLKSIFLIDGTKIENNSANIGGGICNQSGVLAMTNVTLSGNSAVNYGGGLYQSSLLNDNTTTIESSFITYNTVSDGDGGGIYLENEYVDSEFKVNIIDTEISWNVVNNLGGGIYNKIATVHVEGGTISENAANIGGAFYNE